MASMPFLSCKFFALQKTYETIVPASMPAIHGDFRLQVFAKQKPGKSIHAGLPAGFRLGSLGLCPKLRKPKRSAFWFSILPPPFGRTPASMPFLSCKFFALQKTYETIVPASMPVFS
ncbi:MAG: hypothetical protein LBL56_00910, partial [Treponema sp.]|nr:hypothetical protein [Treponema sp.]